MRSVKTLGQWMVLGGVLAWVGARLMPGMRGFARYTGILILGGAVAWVAGAWL